MKALAKLRKSINISQRRLATLSGISYKSLQLIEGSGHDMKFSTLEKISIALKFPKKTFKNYVETFFNFPQDSIAIISRQIAQSKSKDWRGPLFNFVDQIRLTKGVRYVQEPPSSDLTIETTALLASVVETLCFELNIEVPWWCSAIGPLKTPYFVAEVENLKAMTISESPLHFRKRNIFVLNNFLNRT